MTEGFRPGDIIVYPYRWLGEHKAGRSPDGAKERPCCVVLAVADAQGEMVLFLAAVSSKPPGPDQAALEVPDMERRRAGLERYPQAWVYVSELNQDRPATSWYLERQKPLGTFGPRFVGQIVQAVRTQIGTGRVVRRR